MIVVAWLPLLILTSIFWWVVEENSEKAAEYRAEEPPNVGMAKLYEDYWMQSTVLRVVLILFQTLQVVFFILGRCAKKNWGRWAFYYTFCLTFLFQFCFYLWMAISGQARVPGFDFDGEVPTDQDQTQTITYGIAFTSVIFFNGWILTLIASWANLENERASATEEILK